MRTTCRDNRHQLQSPTSRVMLCLAPGDRVCLLCPVFLFLGDVPPPPVECASSAECASSWAVFLFLQSLL